MITPCPACGACLSKMTGSTHAYMLSSPACWEAYGEVLAREYQDPRLFAACHRLTVDAYALQHPGDPNDRRALRSVWLHFAALYSIYERNYDLVNATALLKRFALHEFPPLPAHGAVWAVTVANVQAAPLSDQMMEVERWARCAYDGWAPLLSSRTQALMAAL